MTGVQTCALPIYVLSYQVQKPASVRRKPSRFSDNALVRGLRRSLSWRRSRPAPPPRQDPELAAQENRLDYHDDDRRFRRQDFEENLMEMGLELERDEGVRTGEVESGAECVVLTKIGGW